jgi:ABC-type Fe3+-citrate transport system substrate-binding protein
MSIIKKTTAVAMIAVAALAVSACGKTENTNITENTTVTDMNTMAPEEGTMNDMSGMEMGNEAGNSSNMM